MPILGLGPQALVLSRSAVAETVSRRPSLAQARLSHGGANIGPRALVPEAYPVSRGRLGLTKLLAEPKCPGSEVTALTRRDTLPCREPVTQASGLSIRKATDSETRLAGRGGTSESHEGAEKEGHVQCGNRGPRGGGAGRAQWAHCARRTRARPVSPRELRRIMPGSDRRRGGVFIASLSRDGGGAAMSP